jgi:hypothetical protein
LITTFELGLAVLSRWFAALPDVRVRINVAFMRTGAHECNIRAVPGRGGFA